MKNNIFYLILLVLITSCKSYFVNGYLSKMGVLEDSIKTDNFKSKDKDVVFLHMHHLGTTKFYENVKFKIDSVKKQSYILFYETMTSSTFKEITDMKEAEKADSILLYKFRKIFGHEIMGKKGKTDFMEVLKDKGIKLKKL